MTLPAPFTPPDCDLRTFPYMPIYLDRLLSSDFFSQANDAEFRAGFILWAKAFRELPAGSLPEDVRALTRLAELGQDVGKMRRVRGIALRGWCLCSDGKLYHRVVATIVIEAWIERLKARRKGALGNAKRWGSKLTQEQFDSKLQEACCYLFRLDPQAAPTGIPPAILQRSREDSCSDPTRTSYSDRKLEAYPTGNPSQDQETYQSGGVVTFPVQAHTRGLAGTDEPPADDREAQR